METWAIGRVAARSGVPASTIRYYEQIGLLPPAGRVNSRRQYDETIFEQLSIIRLAQQAGFTIAEIQTLLHDFPAEAPPSARWHRLAHQKLDELAEQMRRIEAMRAMLEKMLACECATLAACVARQQEAAITTSP